MNAPRRHLLTILLATALANAYAAPVDGVLSLTVNGQDKGAVPLLLTDAGEWLIGEAQLRAIGIEASQPSEAIDGRAYFPLARLKGVQTRINEADLTAVLTADTTLLKRQVISLVPKAASRMTPSAKLSGYLNYQVGVYSEKEMGPTVALDGAVRSFDWLLDGQAFYQPSTTANLTKRLKLTRDWPDAMMRVEVGDLPAQSSVPGQSLAMRGVSVSRAFETQPYFQRQPGASFTGSVGVPAEAEIRVDGVTIRTVPLAPGAFDINSLAYRTGLHNATIIIRDRAGNILSTLGGPTYFSTQGLAKGVSDYGFSVGRLTDGVRADQTGFSGRYARGLTDILTVGASVQGEGAQRYASAMGTLTAGALGIVSAQVTKAMGDAKGAGVDAAYGWQALHTSINLAVQRYSKDFFGNALLGSAGLTPLQSLSGSVAYSLTSGRALSLSLASRRYADETSARSISLGYSHRIGDMTLTAQLGRVNGTAPERGVSANLMVSWEMGGSRRTTAYATKNQYGTSTRVDTSDISPSQAGFGYRLSAQADDQKQANGYFEYGFKNAIVSTNLTHTGQTQAGSAFLTSSLVYVDGNLRATRVTRESFAIADVGLPNIRVLRNNQLVGRTGDDGKLFVPYLSAYSANQLTLNEQDVPSDYSLDQHMQVITPARQAGVVATFKLRQVRSAGGRVAGYAQRQADEILVLKGERDVVTTLTNERQEQIALTIRGDGTFYFEELGEGTWTGKAQAEGQPCRIQLVVPTRAEPYLDLGEIVCEKL